MAIATKTGVVDTEGILADEKVVDMASQFKLLDPDESQFSTMLDKLPSAPATREKVNWLEDQYFPRQSSVKTANTDKTGSASLSIIVADQEGAYFRAGDIVRNMTSGEAFEVASVNGDTLTAVSDGTKRKALGTAANKVAISDMQAGDPLLIVSNASAQNADVGTLKVTTRVLGYNYTQIIRHPFGFSGTEVEIETYGKGDPMNEIAKKAVEHKRAKESALFFGTRDFVSGTPWKGYMGGLVEFINSNKPTTIGTLTRAKLDNYLRDILQHGSRNKVIFAAPLPAQALSGLLADNWVKVTDPNTKVYGAKVSAFVSGAFGDNIPVVTKREWGTFGSTGNLYGTGMFVIDMDYVKLRPMRNRGTQLLRNRQGNGVDGVVHEYLTELSLEISQESAHGYLRGITG